eukprot:TRINITY_DN3834_c0_g2_i1.p1 TRINITY_DN3834_c0_g2~~TRINITY_DN3834_c0_g2_i1.p1  ORF type:complete len:440 (-),score=175.63 TRINITY_DN3834_c0_g2_i1:968-2287(-)
MSSSSSTTASSSSTTTSIPSSSSSIANPNAESHALYLSSSATLHHVCKFPRGRIDFKTAAEVRMCRFEPEKPEVKVEGDEGEKKKRRVFTKRNATFYPRRKILTPEQKERQRRKRPWKMKVNNDEHGERDFDGTIEGQSSNYVLFVAQGPGKGFKVLRVAEWYNFLPKRTYQTLDIDEAEEVLAKNTAVVDRWMMMGKKKESEGLEPGEDEDENDNSLITKDKLDVTGGFSDDDDEDEGKERQASGAAANDGDDDGDDDFDFDEIVSDDDVEMGDGVYGDDGAPPPPRVRVASDDEDEDEMSSGERSDDEEGGGDGASLTRAGKAMRNILRKGDREEESTPDEEGSDVAGAAKRKRDETGTNDDDEARTLKKVKTEPLTLEDHVKRVLRRKKHIQAKELVKKLKKYKSDKGEFRRVVKQLATLVERNGKKYLVLKEKYR